MGDEKPKSDRPFLPVKFDERARDMFERREKGRRDAEDREKGALKKQAIGIARNAIDMGMGNDAIIKLTGLTLEEVEALSKTK